MVHPEFEVAHFGDDGVDFDGDDLAFREAFEDGEIDLDAAGFLEFALGVGEDLAGGVAAADFRGKEAEAGGFAGDEPEFAAFDEAIAAFLHALGDDAERFDRRLESGDCRH